MKSQYLSQHLLKLTRENKYVSDVFDFDLQSLNVENED